MKLEESATIHINLDPRFPMNDVQAIAARVAVSKSLVPGYIPPAVGLTSLEAFFFAELITGTSTVILVDRNVVSRMAKIARSGALRPFDTPTQFAVDLMALSQAVNLDIEPSIAFHELAHYQGNEEACEELRWFRAADFGQAQAWIDIALGRTDALPVAEPAPRQELNLAFPLGRWRRNYAALLKAAQLELTPMAPQDRLVNLLDWMISDFFFAGPAALYACMYLSPFASKAGMFKSLRSPERQRALTGIRNAAWDVTYLSDMVRRVTQDPYETKRYLLATADKAVAQIAPLLFIDAGDVLGYQVALSRELDHWWRGDAASIAAHFAAAIDAMEGRPAPQGPVGAVDFVGDLIEQGEAAVLAWHG